MKDLARVEVEDDDLVEGSMRSVIRQALLHCHSSVTDLSFQSEVDTLDKQITNICLKLILEKSVSNVYNENLKFYFGSMQKAVKSNK